MSALTESNFGDDALVVFREFRQTSTNDLGERVVVDGFVFSSRRLLCGLREIFQAQWHGLSLSMDGTYKLTFNGWVLSVLSVYIQYEPKE